MTEIELLEQLLKTGRMPASQPPMAPFLDPSAPKPGDPGYKGLAEEDAAWKAAQSGASQQEQRPIQKIEQTNVVGEPIAQQKVIPKLEKAHSGVDAPTSRYGEMHRQWSNDPLALQLEILPDKDLVEKARQMSEEARTKYVQEAAAPIQGYAADTSQEDKALADLLGERKNLGDSPKTDIWAKAIYHLAPAILGALSGSAGRAAALPSLKMNIDSLRRDEDFALRTYNASKERLDKLERGLLASKKGKQDEAIRRSTLEIEKAKMRIDALRDNANMTAKERSEAIQEEQKKVENLVGNVLGTSKEITTFEQRADEFKSRMDLEKEKLKKGVKKGGPAQTPFQKAQEAALGKNAADYYTNDRAAMVNNLSKIQAALTNLRNSASGKSETLFGQGRGLMPDALRAFTNPLAIQTKEDVRSAIIDTLRPTLGAQFTEKEGERIQSFALNDNLSDEQNAIRVQRLFEYIKKKVEFQDAMFEHLNKGRPFRTFNFAKYGMKPTDSMTGEIPGSSSTGSQEASGTAKAEDFMSEKDKKALEWANQTMNKLKGKNGLDSKDQRNLEYAEKIMERLK